MRKISVTFILAAVVGVLGVSAAAASAAEFRTTNEIYPTKVTAIATNNQGFKIIGVATVCKKGEFVGELTGSSSTLETSISYKECKAQVAGLHEAIVNPNGCTYVFHAPASDSVDIKCPSGKEIEVEVVGLTCKIKIPAQTGLKTIEYENSSPVATVKVNANVKDIVYTVEGCPEGVASGAEGEYRKGNIIVGPPEEVAIGGVTEAAKATAKGSPNTIEVS